MARRHSTGDAAISYGSYLELCRDFCLAPLAADHYAFLLTVTTVGPVMIPCQKGQDVEVYDLNTGTHHPINLDHLKPLDAAQLKSMAAIIKRLPK